MSYKYKTMPSPVGRLRLVASDNGLATVLWENHDPPWAPLESSKDRGCRERWRNGLIHPLQGAHQSFKGLGESIDRYESRRYFG